MLSFIFKSSHHKTTLFPFLTTAQTSARSTGLRMLITRPPAQTNPMESAISSWSCVQILFLKSSLDVILQVHNHYCVGWTWKNIVNYKRVGRPRKANVYLSYSMFYGRVLLPDTVNLSVSRIRTPQVFVDTIVPLHAQQFQFIFRACH